MSDRLTEIAARAAAATPGPWRVEDDSSTLERFVVSGDPALRVNFGYVGNCNQDDAEFAAHARDDVPWLLAQLEQARSIAVRLEQENARLQAQLRDLKRPAIEGNRNEVRQSFAELMNQCREERDYEGAFDVECRLCEREEQWKREDEEATR